MAPVYKLTYFDVKGLGEPIRYLLAYGGIEYEDKRIQFEEWPGMKSKTPCGKLPLLEVDGELVHQSVAISRYLGKKLQLTGSDDWEAMMCDIAVDTLSDLRFQVTAWFREKDEEIREKKRAPLFREILPFYIDRLDKEVEKNSGHFVRGKLTWADFYIVPVVEAVSEMLDVSLLDKYRNLKALSEKINNIPQIKTWIEIRPKTPF